MTGDIIPTVNTTSGILIDDSDGAIKRATLIKLYTEVATGLLMLYVFAEKSGALEQWKCHATAQWRRWRFKLLGPARPSEEVIKNWSKQTIIEATRIVRGAT